MQEHGERFGVEPICRTLGVSAEEPRNSDVGIFNALVTMGVVGSVLLYLPPLWLLCALLRRSRWRAPQDSYLWMGGAIWLLIALIASITLDNLVSVSGLATIAVGIGVLSTRLGTSLEGRTSPR